MERQYELLQAIEQTPGSDREIHRGTYAKALPVLITRERHKSLQDANHALNELFALISLTHPNISQVHDCFLEDTEDGQLRTVLITELLDAPLSKEIALRRPAQRLWTTLELAVALDCLARALAFAQAKGIAHRDVKPASIYITADTYKFGNFSSAIRLMDEGKLAKTMQGSVLYLSPEMRQLYVKFIETQHMSDQIYDPFKSDVYSLAITMIEMALLAPPNDLNGVLNSPSVVEEVLRQLTAHELLVPLLREMLNMDPTQRPSFEGVLSELKGIITQLQTAQYSSYSLPSPKQSLLHLHNVVRPDPILCLICEQEVTNFKWTAFIQISNSSPIPDVCSLCCFHTFQENPHRQSLKCAICFKSVPPLSILTIKPPCGHIICRLECLFDSAQRRHDRAFFQTGLLKCIRCREMTSTVQKGDSTLRLVDLLQQTVCSLCQMARGEVVLVLCGHQLCGNCAKTRQCPVCSRKTGSLRV